jgi:hypothetical protein
MGIMSMKREGRNIKTPLSVIVLVWAIAVFSGLVFGGIGAVLAYYGSFGFFGIAIVALVFSFEGGVRGAILAGLYSLICGSQLGKGFAYLFWGYLGCVIGGVLAVWIEPYDASVGSWAPLQYWCIGGAAGLAGGALTNLFACGYGPRARIGAIVGAVPMLLVGVLVVHVFPWSRVDFALRDLYWIAMLIVAGAFALFGGSFGAVLGGAADRFGQDVEPPESPVRL